MSTYRVLQLTNPSVGAVTASALLPLGTITRRIVRPCSQDVTTFTTSTSGTNIVTINECGYYRVSYNITGVAAAAGIIGATLLVNNTAVTSTSQTVDAGATTALQVTYEIRVLPNCESNPGNNPVNISMQLTGVGLTAGNSNLLVERVY